MDAAHQGELVQILQGAGLPPQLLRPVLAKVAEADVNLGDLKVTTCSEWYSSCTGRRPFAAPAWTHCLKRIRTRRCLPSDPPIKHKLGVVIPMVRSSAASELIRAGYRGIRCSASGAVAVSCIP